MDVRRGDIFLVDLNPVVGTEQAGIRPALVVQIDRANVRLTLWIVQRPYPG